MSSPGRRACRRPSDLGRPRRIATGDRTAVALTGYRYVATYGSTVVAIKEDTPGSSTGKIHLLRVNGGLRADIEVAGISVPAQSTTYPWSGDATAMVLERQAGLVTRIDLGTGTWADVGQHPLASSGLRLQITATRVLWYDDTNPSFWTVPRSGGIPQQVLAPLPANGVVEFLATSGDWFLSGQVEFGSPNPSNPTSLMATPFDGGPSVPVLTRPWHVATLGDGSAMAIAGVGLTHAIHHLAPQVGGPPTATSVGTFSPVPANMLGVALSGRRLVTLDDSGYRNAVVERIAGRFRRSGRGPAANRRHRRGARPLRPAVPAGAGRRRMDVVRGFRWSQWA